MWKNTVFLGLPVFRCTINCNFNNYDVCLIFNNLLNYWALVAMAAPSLSSSIRYACIFVYLLHIFLSFSFLLFVLSFFLCFLSSSLSFFLSFFFFIFLSFYLYFVRFYFLSLFVCFIHSFIHSFFLFFSSFFSFFLFRLSFFVKLWTHLKFLPEESILSGFLVQEANPSYLVFFNLRLYVGEIVRVIIIGGHFSWFYD